MELRLLGSIELRAAGRVVSLGGPRQRSVVAALAVDVGGPVPVDTLVDRVWGETPPPRARHALHVYIARFRRLLRQHLEDPSAARVVRHAGGYALEVDPERVDVHRFRRLVEQARDQSCPDQRRVAVLRRALDLWRGPPLAGLPGAWAAGVRQAWQQRYLDAVVGWARACLRVGDPGVVVACLADLLGEHPTVESLAAAYLRALCAAGRPADALDHYARLRALLSEELGTDPGPELRQLHRQILTADPALTRPVTAPVVPPPRHLPAPPPMFIGRARELAELDLSHDPATVVTVVIDGMAGVGKTALALHWAHRAADRFPDGQLYVNLRGFDPGGAPVAPAAALRGFLDALDVPAQRVPDSVDDQAARYRGLLAGRRLLVLLDNARDAEQVRPLLPGSPGCLAVITSRSELTGLVAEGARPLRLDLLSPAEARQLLAGRLGVARAASAPAAVDALVGFCARLPLALAVASARAAVRPDRDLATLATELRELRHRLDAFDTGDPLTSMRAVFSWSYRRLSADAARLFRLLSLHPGPDVSAPAAAGLAGAPLPEARSRLVELTQAHLVAEDARGRYALHDLLRAYATELAHAHDPEPRRREATRRLLDHYLHTAYAAARCLDADRGPLALPEPGAGAGPERIIDHEHAMAWFAAERSVLLGSIDRATAAGFDVHTWQVAWTLSTFLDRQGHWHDWVAAQAAALAATERLGDRLGQARCHNGIGLAYAQLGRLDEAHDQHARALRLFRELGDLAGQAQTHMNLCWVFERRDRLAEALQQARRALARYREAGHPGGQADALNNIGWYHTQLGEHRSALDYCRQALTIQRKLGNPHGEADAWDSIGYAHHQLGESREAVEAYQHAAGHYREVGERYGEADVLVHLGDVRHAAGDPTAAGTAWRLALEILEELGHPDADEVRARLRSSPGPGRVEVDADAR